MRRLLAPAWALVMLAAPNPAEPALGEAGGLTLLLPMAARPAAMGEAFAAGAGSADSLGYNPAGLAQLKGPETGALYYGGFAGDRYVSVLLGAPLAGVGAAAGVAYYDSGSVAIIQPPSLDPVEVSAQRDIVVHAGAGMRIPRTAIAVGLSGKVLNTTMIEEFSTTQVAGDAGIMIGIPTLGVELGLCAQNIGPRLDLEKDRVSLPFLVRTGIAYRLELPALSDMAGNLAGYRPAKPPSELLALGEVVARINEETTSLAFGLEYLAGSVVSVRGGYRAILEGAAQDTRVYTAGAGIRVSSLRLDYAIEILSFTALHRVGLTFAPFAAKDLITRYSMNRDNASRLESISK